MQGSWDGLLTPDAAKEEAEEIAASRALLPETTYAPEEEGHDALTVPTGSEEQTENPAAEESGETVGKGTCEKNAAGTEVSEKAGAMLIGMEQKEKQTKRKDRQEL